MRTECCNCDRVAVAFHGDAAYCRKCMPAGSPPFKPTSLQIDTIVCTSCENQVHWTDIIKCGCGMKLCEACYDRQHQEHGL